MKRESIYTLYTCFGEITTHHYYSVCSGQLILLSSHLIIILIINQEAYNIWLQMDMVVN